MRMQAEQDENAPGRGVLALGHPATEPETAAERRRKALEKAEREEVRDERK